MNRTERMSEREPLHDCPDCRCGTIKLCWSDREAHVFPDDLDRIAEVVFNCALDHSYDRHDGVPDGLDDARTKRLVKVVAEHLGRINPAWRDVTVSMPDEGAQAAFLRDLRAAL